MRVLVEVARRMELSTWHWTFSPSLRIENRAVVRQEVQGRLRLDQRALEAGRLEPFGRGAGNNYRAREF